MRLSGQPYDAISDRTSQAAPLDGDCAWWNLVCQGGQQVADSGLNAITQSMISGLVALFGQITKVVDESTRVPLADEAYRDTYYGFAGLAVPVIAAVYFVALLSAAFHRDPRALVRATVGIAVAAIGGVVYVLFAQLLVATDDWLAHSVVSVTGADFGEQMGEIAGKFERMGGAVGAAAANFLMLILMFSTLVAGVVLWVVLLLRKMAILVVVVFAPLLIAGWLWPPTRSWSRKATEVLVALVFCKSVIYVIFGVGMSLLFRDSQSLSDLVGVVVLLVGACFAPLVMLRLVHFAADSQLAGEMVGTLRSAAQPTVNRLAGGSSTAVSRNQMARDYATRASGSTAKGGRAVTSSVRGAGKSSGAVGSPTGATAGASSGAGVGKAATGATGATGGAGAAGAGGAGAAGGPAGVAVAVGAQAVNKGAEGVKKGAGRAVGATQALTSAPAAAPPPTSSGPTTDDRQGRN